MVKHAMKIKIIFNNNQRKVSTTKCDRVGRLKMIDNNLFLTFVFASEYSINACSHRVHLSAAVCDSNCDCNICHAPPYAGILQLINDTDTHTAHTRARALFRNFVIFDTARRASIITELRVQRIKTNSFRRQIFVRSYGSDWSINFRLHY